MFEFLFKYDGNFLLIKHYKLQVKHANIINVAVRLDNINKCVSKNHNIYYTTE